VKVFMMQQGSTEWFDAKKGIPSASNFDRILTNKTGTFSAQAGDYIAELVSEVFSPFLPENAQSYTSNAMRHGQETEAEARRYYSMERDTDVQQVGGCMTDDGKLWCSPDGLVGENGGCEIKCPLPKTHAKYLLNEGLLLEEYKQQVHGALLITGRPWWDLISYSLGMPAVLVRVEPSSDTDRLKVALDRFCDEYQSALAKIRRA
jgi:hypothetical protein